MSCQLDYLPILKIHLFVLFIFRNKRLKCFRIGTDTLGVLVIHPRSLIQLDMCNMFALSLLGLFSNTALFFSLLQTFVKEIVLIYKALP